MHPPPASVRARVVSAFVAVLAAGSLRAADTSSTGGGQGLPLGQPGLGLRYCIAFVGYFPAENVPNGHRAGDGPMIGEIRLFSFANLSSSGTNFPGGWLDCDGRLLAIAAYPELFTVIGTAFGGNGTTTFALPDLRGRAAVARGTISGSGLTDHPLGESFGAPVLGLTAAHLPSHVHAMAGAQTGATGTGSAFPRWRPSLALGLVLSPLDVLWDFESEMRLFAGDYEPESWLDSDGRVLSPSSYPDLHVQIGTTYSCCGQFSLPALPGRVAEHGTDLQRGTASGAESTTLTGATLPAHTHATAAGSTGSTGATGAIDRRQPTLAIRYVIATDARIPAESTYTGPTPFTGEIRPFAGIYPPARGVPPEPFEFLFCDGQLLAADEYPVLANLIGATYGGDGVTTIALPDLNGRVPIGTGTGPGLAPVSLGQLTGWPSPPMSVAQMPAHVHVQPAPEIEVRGNAVVIADGDTTPDAADHTEFPPTDVAGAPAVRTFTVSNAGLGDLTLSASLSGAAAFAISSPPASVVAPGGNTALQVSFDPGTEGTFSATVTIANDDPDEAPFDFAIGGTGVARHPGAVAQVSLGAQKNAPDPALVDLSWGPSCGAGLTGYAVYEGALGSFSSHALIPGRCNVPVTSAQGILPAAGNRYFLVSAIDGVLDREGSLGKSSAGVERAFPAGACETTQDLVSCLVTGFLSGLDGAPASTSSSFETGAYSPLPTLGWTAVFGAAQVYDLATNGGLVGATPYGNYQVEYVTGVPVEAYSRYELELDMGFMAAIVGGSATYELELGTHGGGTFTPLQSAIGTVVYAGNLSAGVVSGSAKVTVVTGAAVTGQPLAIRWRQTATAGTSDYFGIDDVTLSVTN